MSLASNLLILAIHIIATRLNILSIQAGKTLHEKGKPSERIGRKATGPEELNGGIAGLPCKSSAFDKAVLCAVNRESR